MSANAVISDELTQRLLEGPNPFEPVILPFDRALDVPDVPAIHAEGLPQAGRGVGSLRRPTRSDAPQDGSPRHGADPRARGGGS